MKRQNHEKSRIAEIPSLDDLKRGSFCESAAEAAASPDASAEKSRADAGAEAVKRKEEGSLDAATPRRRTAAASLDMSPAARRRKREESGMAEARNDGSQVGSLRDLCSRMGYFWAVIKWAF
jgi:hypothetical protein